MPSTPLQGEPKHQAVPITDEGIVISGSGYGKVQFDNGAITFYRKSKRWIKFQTYLKGTVYTPTARQIDANTITYQGGNWFQAKYEFWDDSLKETITLQSKQHLDISDLSFLITTSEGTHVEQQANGDLWLVRDLDPRCLMVLPAPTCVDTNSVAYPIAWSYNVTTKFLTITGDLTGAKFPLTIDPSVQLDTAVEIDATPGRCCARDTAGRIWVAWFDDLDIEVGYSDDNGGTFTKEEPWTSKFTCYNLAIAVDSSRDLHVVWSYLDTSTYIKHLKRTHLSGTWSSVIDVATGNSYTLDLIVASDDTLYALNHTTVYYYNLTSWSSLGSGLQSGDTAYPYGTSSSILRDSQGHIHLFYSDQSTTPWRVRHNEYTTSWGTAETVYQHATEYVRCAMAARGSDGTMHVVASRTSGSNGFVYMKKPEGGSWSSEVISVNNGWYPWIILNRGDVPGVMIGSSNITYFYIRAGDGTWSSQTAYTNGGNYYCSNGCWAFFPRCDSYLPGGTPIGGCIGAATHWTGSKYYAVFFQTNDFQPANTCETVYSCQLAATVDSYTSLTASSGRKICRDSAGRIWVVYTHAGSPHIHVRYSDDGGKVWAVEDPLSGATAYSASIAVDANKDLHLVYESSSTPHEIQYKKRTHSDSTWGSAENVTSGSSVDQTIPAIVIDSSNYPHVVWKDGSYILKYRYKTSGGWQTAETVVDNGSNNVDSPSIALDTSNDAHVSYGRYVTSSLEPFYKKRTSGTWGGEETLCSASGSSNVYATSIVIDSSGNPRVLWQAYSLIRYNAKSGGSWGTYESLSSAYAGYTCLSLSIDQDDYCYAIYVASSGNTIIFQKRTTSWGSQTTVFDPYSTLLCKGVGLIWGYSSDKRSIPDTGAMAVFVAETVSTDYQDVYVWKSSDLTWRTTVTKSLAYEIYSGGWQSHTIQHDLLYAVKRSVTAIQKNLNYTILKTQSLGTKDLTYYVAKLQTVQRNLNYTIYATVAPVTRSLAYTLLTTPAAKTKGLAYYISSTPVAAEKQLAYSIVSSVTPTTKDLSYSISVPTTIQKDSVYAIYSTVTPITKELTYGMIGGAILEKGLTYTVSAPVQPITKNLSYAITSVAPTVQKTLDYKVQTLTSTTKPLNYSVQWIPLATGKMLAYAILATVPLEKDLEYAISSTQTYQVDKSLTYTIITTGSVGTKELQYCIVVAYTPTKGLTYSVSSTYTPVHNLTYSIYASASFTKDLTYVIGVYGALEQPLTYTILATPQAGTQSLTYTISHTTLTEYSLSYCILRLPTLTKDLSYVILGSTTFYSTLEYRISVVQFTQLDLAYNVIPSAPTLTQVGSCIKIDWVVT